jgi:4-hydroxybenzoate polyprenyltransferase
MRLHNALIAGGGLWLGVACRQGLSRNTEGGLNLGFPTLPSVDSLAQGPNWLGWVAASLGLLALAAAGNAENDVLDAEADRINRPDRPLPSDRISPQAALLWAALLYLIGILLPGVLSWSHAGLAMGMAALLWMYNRRWKRAPLAGNLCVSLLCALAVYFPEWPGLPLYTGIPVLFAFLTTLAREIAKDLQDRPGDKIAGYRTWPLVSGPTRPGQTVLGLHIAIAA